MGCLFLFERLLGGGFDDRFFLQRYKLLEEGAGFCFENKNGDNWGAKTGGLRGMAPMGVNVGEDVKACLFLLNYLLRECARGEGAFKKK